MEVLGGRGTRLALLIASLLAGLVIALLNVHLAGQWRLAGTPVHFRALTWFQVAGIVGLVAAPRRSRPAGRSPSAGGRALSPPDHRNRRHRAVARRRGTLALIGSSI